MSPNAQRWRGPNAINLSGGPVTSCLADPGTPCLVVMIVPHGSVKEVAWGGAGGPSVGRVSTGTSEVRHPSVESTAVLARERPRRIGVK
eukprot:366032-Chlamydomonas_euryale.AAC.5